MVQAVGVYARYTLYKYLYPNRPLETMSSNTERYDPVVSAKIPKQVAEAMNEKVYRLGINRSQYIRQLVQYDLDTQDQNTDRKR